MPLPEIALYLRSRVLKLVVQFMTGLIDFILFFGLAPSDCFLTKVTKFSNLTSNKTIMGRVPINTTSLQETAKHPILLSFCLLVAPAAVTCKNFALNFGLL